MDDLSEFLKEASVPEAVSHNIEPITSNKNDVSNNFPKRVRRNDFGKEHNMPKISSNPISNGNVDKTPPLDIIGINVIRPAISNRIVSEQIGGMSCIQLSQIQSKMTSGSLGESFVTAGIIVNSTTDKVNQKGVPYSIWNMTDLNGNTDTISLFLFKSAHVQFWKTVKYKVILIVNPQYFHNKNSAKAEISLSVENPMNLLVLGDSKDIGTCQSKTKSGNKCTAIVNINKCAFCIFHVKQQHAKSFTSKRSLPPNARRDPNLTVSTGFAQTIRPNIMPSQNAAIKTMAFSKTELKKTFSSQAMQAQALRILGNKSIDKIDPNNVKFRSTSVGRKRFLEKFDESNAPKNNPEQEDDNSKRAKLIMSATSKHTSTVDARTDNEEGKYFNKLAKKEDMEDVMINTFAVKCKAVSCRECNYTSFSAANKCIVEKHNTIVIDAQKRFFVCDDCGNRTVSLTRLPKLTCRNCNGSKWKRTAMIKDNLCNLKPTLSIRGDEVKFL